MFVLLGETKKVRFLFAGYPCVSLSGLTTTPHGLEDKTGATGRGYDSVLGYIDAHQPDVVALENVANLFHRRKLDKFVRPSDMQNKDMQLRGYIPSCNMADAGLYGLPQSRRRAWGLYIKARFAKHSVSQQALTQRFLSFQCESLPLEAILLDSTETRHDDGTPQQSTTVNRKWNAGFDIAAKKLGKAINMKSAVITIITSFWNVCVDLSFNLN
jgi:site-specific DNA-cytosine methylase